MSRLVSDLFDICEFAHHGPENVFISLLKIIGSFFLLLLYIHVPLTVLLMIVTILMLLFSASSKQADAGYLYGKQTKDCRCQCGIAGYAGRHPRREVICK